MLRLNLSRSPHFFFQIGCGHTMAPWNQNLDEHSVCGRVYKHLYRALVWIICLMQGSKKKFKEMDKVLKIWWLRMNHQVNFTAALRILTNQDCGVVGLSELQINRSNWYVDSFLYYWDVRHPFMPLECFIEIQGVLELREGLELVEVRSSPCKFYKVWYNLE